MVSANNAINDTVGASISGVTNTLTITNPSNTASSQARNLITVGGASAGDPYTQYTVSGVTDFSMGIDNNATDSLKIAASGTLGSTDTWIMTTAGERTMPLQPGFLGYQATDLANATGDGTIYSLGSTTALTEAYDQNSDFTTAGVFTAPVTGKYLLMCQFKIGGITAAMTYGLVNIRTSGAVYPCGTINFSNVRTVAASPNLHTISGSVIANMTAGNTATVEIQISGGTRTASVLGIGAVNTFFCGWLLG